MPTDTRTPPQAAEAPADVGSGLLSALQRFWGWIIDLGHLLWPCRVSIVVLVGAGLILLRTGQGRESTLALAQASCLAQFSFFVALSLWIFMSWFWARLMMKTAYSLDRTRGCKRRRDDTHGGYPLDCTERLTNWMKWVVRWAPRIIGSLSGLLAAAAFVWYWGETHSANYVSLAIISFLIAVIAGWLFYKRTSILRTDNGWLLTRWIRKIARTGVGRPRVGPKQAYTSPAHLPLLELGVALLTVLGAGLAMVLAIFWTAPAAMTVGTLAVAFSAFAFLIAGGGMLSFLSAWWRLPVDVTVVIFALLLSFLPWTDNHGVRVLDGTPRAMVPSGRPSLDAALDQWWTALRETNGQPLLVIVSTAGGGLRAAAWTQVVLGTLEDRVKNFHKHVFAISGVSGGSFGAALFDTLLTLENNPSWQLCEHDAATSYTGRGRCILEQDYLAPAVAGLLYPDLLQRFVPFPHLADRAMALELGWERGWTKKNILHAGNSPFTEPFLNLWSDCDAAQGCWRPALMLNGTHVETGKRIITSNLRIEQPTFTDAADVYDLIDSQADFRVSTAVNNSARFPYVAPAGTLRKTGEATAHIVDGGYFENFGASTAAELLRAVVGHFGAKVRPIVIQISSDPQLTEKRLPACTEAPRPDTYSPEFPTEIFAPLDASFATREARGILAAKELCHLATDAVAPLSVDGDDTPSNKATQKDRFFHFRMYPYPDSADPGLGWTMSSESFDNVSKLIDKRENAGQLEALVRLLNGATRPE